MTSCFCHIYTEQLSYCNFSVSSGRTIDIFSFGPTDQIYMTSEKQNVATKMAKSWRWTGSRDCLVHLLLYDHRHLAEF